MAAGMSDVVDFGVASVLNEPSDCLGPRLTVNVVRATAS
jgi:hypothetical protein